MAQFEVTVNAANASPLGIAENYAITPEHKKAILMAGGTALRDGMQEYLRQHHNRTGELAGSITATDHTELWGEVWVEPAGQKTGRRRGRGRQLHTGSGATRRNKHHGAKGGATMQEVAWYLEYGTPRMHFTKWFTNSLNDTQPKVDAAMEEAFGKILGE